MRNALKIHNNGGRAVENKQLLPFERNRYYSGKILTSTDFIAEQLYMNNKRRFMNNILFGSGVLCGLNVLSLDDLSILLESGVAIDNTGREIVVDSTSVKKLSTIEGFENIKSDHVILYLKYDENNYFEAKEFTLESIPQNEEEVYYYDDYVFYLNKRPWGTDGAYNFTMACYNDVNHTLIFIGYDDGNPSLTEEEIENIGSNWKEFIDKNYGKYYDFES